MSELITKLNPALVMEAMQAPAIIYEKDSIEQFIDERYKSHIYDSSTRIGVIILHDSTIPVGMFSGRPVSKVQLLNITSIDDKAFYYCDNLTSIIIPDSVTKMGKNVFTGCTGELTINCHMPDNSNYSFSAFIGAAFTKITIGNGVTSIGDWTFYGCGDLTSVTIPNSVTSIGNSAFYNCWNLTNVIIPDSVTSIGKSAFYGCERLTRVTIPNSVTEIGDSAFSNCHSLTSVIIPDSVTKIEDFVFWECTSLTNVVIPDSVTRIGECAFFECGLTSVTIPKHVTDISDGAFNTCSQLSTIYCKASTPPDTVEDAGCLPYNSGLKVYIPLGSLELYKKHEYWNARADILIETVFEDEALESGTNIKTIGGQSILGEGDISFVQPITYKELRILHDLQQLIPGRFYRITDYTAITKQLNTRSVHHDFDIVVQALDTHTLSHDAFACAKKDDMYFKNADLSSWKLKYDMIPDESKYPWVPNDTYQTWFCSYGTLHKTISGTYPTYMTKTINGSVKYLYPLNAISNLDVLYSMVYPEGVSSLNDILLVTDRPSFQEEDNLTLLIINKNTGVVYQEFQQTNWWSQNNVGFGVNTTMFDVYNYGETQMINGKTYYVWISYADRTSILISYIGGSVTRYDGSGSDLYCVMSQPLSHELESYECWTYDEGEEECSIEVIEYMDGLWSSESDTLYTHVFNHGDENESEIINLDRRIAIKGVIDMPSKGVIYELHDDKGNTASFDFKSIQANIKGSFCYLLGTSKYDASLTTYCNNTIKSDNIPLLSLQALSTNNTITCVKYTDEWLSTKDLNNNSIYLENKAQLTDCPYTNCTITLVDGYFNYGYPDSILTNDYGFTDSTINISKGMLRYTSVSYTINNLSIFLTGNTNNYLSLSNYPKNNTYPYTTVVTNGLIGYKRKDVDLVFHTFTTNVLTLNSGWYHKQTKATNSLMLKIAESSNVGNTYQCEFTTHTSGTALVVPYWLQWENGEVPELLNNTTYLLTIIGDKAKCKPFYTDSNYFKMTYVTSNSQTTSVLDNITNGSVLTNVYDGIGTITYNKPVTSIGRIPSNSTLTSLVLPDSVTKISYSALYSCSNLVDITIGSNISSADFDSTSLRNIYAPSIEAWIGIDHQSKYPNTIAITCGDDPFQGSLTIPEGVPYIGKYALRGSDFTEITIPSTVTNIGSNPLPGFTGDLYINSQDILSKVSFGSLNYNCGTPARIILGGTIHTIPSKFCYYKYSNLLQIVLPSTLKELQSNCLDSDIALRIPKLKYSTINVAHDAIGISIKSVPWVFEDPNDVFKLKRISQTGYYSSNSFYDRIALRDSNGMSVTAFENSKNVIFDYALSGYKDLKNLTINPTSIGSYAFYNCNQLGTRNEVNLGNRLQYIGKYAFYKTSLKTITLPRTIEYIGEEAFNQNSKLATVYCKAIVPPEMPVWAFYTTTTVYVPRNSVEAYKAAPGWSTYKNQIQPYDFIETFTFTVGTDSYTAKEGMTWREWVNSSYNTSQALEIWYPYGDEMIGSAEESYIIYREECMEEDEYDCWNEYIYPDDEIIPTYSYYKEWY